MLSVLVFLSSESPRFNLQLNDSQARLYGASKTVCRDYSETAAIASAVESRISYSSLRKDRGVFSLTPAAAAAAAAAARQTDGLTDSNHRACVRASEILTQFCLFLSVETDTTNSTMCQTITSLFQQRSKLCIGHELTGQHLSIV